MLEAPHFITRFDLKVLSLRHYHVSNLPLGSTLLGLCLLPLE
ncbi:hypothetical protein [Brochothrix phage ADU4]|nr:hypothetical protein [Brochothrix phage ADU4]